jgi:hypothetical protein
MIHGQQNIKYPITVADTGLTVDEILKQALGGELSTRII